MSDFWAKARGITPRPGSAPRAIPRTPAQYNQVQPVQPQYAGLAVPPPSNGQNQQLQQFYEQGYNDTHVPQWVKEQPTQLCPNCTEADYLITNGHGHCWLCGYSSDRRMSDGQLGNASRARSNGPAQPVRQAHSLGKNFGVATPNV